MRDDRKVVARLAHHRQRRIDGRRAVEREDRPGDVARGAVAGFGERVADVDHAEDRLLVPDEETQVAGGERGVLDVGHRAVGRDERGVGARADEVCEREGLELERAGELGVVGGIEGADVRRVLQQVTQVVGSLAAGDLGGGLDAHALQAPVG